MIKSSRRKRIFGYARVSTWHQHFDSQVQELQDAGCETIYRERLTGSSQTRPVLERLLRRMRAGDELVIVRLDRLGRSMRHILEIIETLEAKGASFRSVHDPIDTSCPQGMFALHALAAIAEFERSLISERTKAGIWAAKARGKLPGNPGVRARDPEALCNISRARQQARVNKLISTADQWMPTVHHLRPSHSWKEVTKVLNNAGQSWTPERLRRATAKMVSFGMADASLLTPCRSHPQSSDELTSLIAAIAIGNPRLSLRDIATHLQRTGQRTPRGNPHWCASSVKYQLSRAERIGLFPKTGLMDRLDESTCPSKVYKDRSATKCRRLKRSSCRRLSPLWIFKGRKARKLREQRRRFTS